MNIEILGLPSQVEPLGEKGEQVLLLHGWGKEVSIAKHMMPLAKRLAADYRVTMLAFPGHGGTGKPKEPWGVPEYAAWTAAAMQALKIDKATIVGHSFGARVAIYLAAEQPQLVNRLVLTGAAGLRPVETAEEKQRQKALAKEKAQIEKLEKWPLVGPLVKSLHRVLRDMAASADYRELDEDMKATFVRVINLDLRDKLPKIGVPTLLVFGDKDTETPLWMGEEMATSIPDAALVVFENRGHFAYLEETERFAKLVKALIVEDEKQRG